MSENPAVVVLLVHTHKLSHHDLIKILNDLQSKKTYGGRLENIYIVICLLVL